MHRHVGGDDPGFRREHLEVEDGFQIGLVEHRVHAAGVRHFELGVQVDVAVRGVDGAVQALAGIGIAAQRLDRDLVVLLKVGQFDAVVDEHLARIERNAVEFHGFDVIRDEVEEGGCAASGAEADAGRAAEGLAADSEVEIDVIVDGGLYNGLAFFGLDAGEI